MSQTNRFMGWPPPIPLNCEQQKIRLVVDPGTSGLVARPYRPALKYLNYYKDVDQNVHVSVFQEII